MNPKINDNIKEWINRRYSNHDDVKDNRGKVTKYPAMAFDFTEKR